MIAFKTAGFTAAFFVAFSGTPTHVKAADLPSGYTCHDLRTKVAAYGVKVILASARSRGMSETTIAQIRGKCRV